VHLVVGPIELVQELLSLFIEHFNGGLVVTSYAESDTTSGVSNGLIGLVFFKTQLSVL
jgi:hypothetical protein